MRWTKSIIVYLTMIAVVWTSALDSPVAAQENLNVGTEIRVSPMSTGIVLREDQWAGRWQQTRLELSALALVDGQFRVKYSLTPAPAGSAFSLIPSASLVVGTTEFGKDPTQQGQTGTNEQKPVSLDWRHDTAHRLEASYFWPYPVRPLVVAEWVGCTLTATGEKDGKSITDTETFRRGFVGFGAVYQVEPSRLMRVSLQGVTGSGFTRAEGSVMWGLNETTALSLGYAIQRLQFEGLRLNEQGFFGGATVAF